MARAWLRTGETVLIDEGDLHILGGAYSYFRQLSAGTTYVQVVTILDSGIMKSSALHRMILRPPKGFVVDHINFNGLDNRRCNLRLATSRENAWHCQKQRGRQTSKFKGVVRRPHDGPRPWKAHISLNRKQIHLGCFASEEEAAVAYDRAAITYFGEFAHLNLPLGIKAATTW